MPKYKDCSYNTTASPATFIRFEYNKNKNKNVSAHNKRQ